MLDVLPEPIMSTPLSTLLSERFSCRDFKANPLPDGLLEEILSDALQSPSWSNTQPYRFAIAQGDVRERLSSEFKRRFQLAAKVQRAGPLGRIWAWLSGNQGLPSGDFKQALVYPKELQPRRLKTAKALYELLGVARGDLDARDAQTARNFEFFGAPSVVFIFVHRGLGVYSVLDAGICLQSILLAAQSQGVATCAQGALALWRAPLDAEFDIPKDYQLLCGVSLGYASDHPVNQFESTRLALSELAIPER